MLAPRRRSLPSSSTGTRAEKNAVVIDLGSYDVKCGFAGENEPRKIVKTNTRLQRLFTNTEGKRSTREEWLDELLHLFKEIYFVHLDTKPKERRVHLLSYHNCCTNLYWAAGEALLRYFEIPSLLISSCSGMALLVTGILSGLVIDIGHVDARCLGIYDGVALENTFSTCSVKDTTIDQLIQTCEDEDSLLSTILESVRACPVSLRTVLVQNVVLVGGLLLEDFDPTRIRLIQDGLMKGLKEVMDADARFSIARPAVHNHFNFATVGVSPKITSWLGGSVASSLESFAPKSVGLKVFEQYPFIFDPSNLKYQELLRQLKEHGNRSGGSDGEVVLEPLYFGCSLNEFLVAKMKKGVEQQPEDDEEEAVVIKHSFIQTK